MSTNENPTAGGQQAAIQGIFSTEVKARGNGATSQHATRKVYVHAEQLDAKTVEVQPLNANQVPKKKKKTVCLEAFLDGYVPEPEFYLSTVYPRMRALQDHVERGETHR